jgi:hypothetical protein
MADTTASMSLVSHSWTRALVKRSPLMTGIVRPPDAPEQGNAALFVERQ